MAKSKTEKHSIRNNVIAGVIILIIAAISTELAGWLPTVLKWFSDCTSWIAGVLVKRVTLPVWPLVIGGVLTLPTIIRIIGAIIRRKEPWKEYTEDEFHNMTWRWRYYGDEPVGLTAFCPIDETQVLWVIRFGRGAPNSVDFRCETCGRILEEIEGTQSHIQSMICRQIDRKLRTGEWKHAVETGRAADTATNDES